jgi:hypothetical protein
MNEVAFKSDYYNYDNERTLINCTVRRVDPEDERFIALREGKVTHITIYSTYDRSHFTRELKFYSEFSSLTLGLSDPDGKAVMIAKIGWRLNND